MSKAEKTRQFIIERSAPIFNIKGYAGTSLNDLVNATGLTRGSIYGNFENKDEVAVAVYHYNVAVLNRTITEFLHRKRSAGEQLAGITDYYRLNWKKIFEKGGCPIQNASVEADDHLPFLKKHVRQSIKSWTQALSKIIEKGKESGEFRKNTDASAYAYTMITLLEGGLMLGKIMNDHQLLFIALDRIDAIINHEIKK